MNAKIKSVLMTLKKVFFTLILIVGASGFNSFGGPNYPEPTAKGEHWGYAYMNNGFRLVINYLFDGADTFDAVIPRARVQLGNDYFLIDPSGKICAGPYEYVTTWADPSTGYYIFSFGEKQGVIDMDGIVILKPEYTHLNFSGNGTVTGLLNDEYVEISLSE